MRNKRQDQRDEDRAILEALGGHGLVAQIIAEARVKAKPLCVAVLILESQNLGARLVVSSIEHGDGEGIAYVCGFKHESVESGALQHGESLVVRLYRFEGGNRGEEINDEEYRDYYSI